LRAAARAAAGGAPAHHVDHFPEIAMRRLTLILALVGTAACGGRPIQTQTAAQPNSMATASVQLTNNASQAVNVYVVSAGTDIFLKQVAARSTESLPVRGVADGSTVTLRATTVDGSYTYSKQNVVLSGSYVWQVP
jgi:ABC-type glycerol-3-phosphate transport system substrate-binding protein